MYKIFSIIIVLATLINAETTPTNFNQRYYNNLQGNIKVIGNTILRSPNANNSNDDVNLTYIDIDDDSNTFNSSSATIGSTLNNINVSNAKIKWAGLYWVGYLHNDSNDPAIDNQYNFNVTNPDAKINYILDNQNTVKLKIDNGNYIDINATKVNKYQYSGNNGGQYVSYMYNAYADVTKYLKDKSPNHKYTVANIPTRSGRTDQGSFYDGLGTYGAWTLVVVYENKKESMEKTRNISIYDGYEIIDSDLAPSVDINFSGFKTPKIAPNGVDSKIYIFAAEGDRFLLGDGAFITNQNGYQYTLPNAPGTNSYFASSIDGVPNREPKIANNNGIDIHINNIGTKYGKDKPIKTNQTKAKLTMNTNADVYMPTMAAFSTELYTPHLCYDYTLKLNKYQAIPSQDRFFKVNSLTGDRMTLKVMLRSTISDFDIINSQQYITFTPDQNSTNFPFDFSNAEISYSNSNIYTPVTPIDYNTGIIPIGKDINNSGGTIGALERMYSKTYFETQNGGSFQGKFDINVEGDISFDGKHNVHYHLTTAAAEGSPYRIDRCPTNPVYDPIIGMFNVENGNANFNQTEADRYSLPTQVTEVPYKLTIASYKKDGNGKYTIKKNRKTNLEVELIDAGNFENNSSSGYDSTCEDPDSYSKGAWVKFKNKNRVNLKIPKDYPYYPYKLALRKAAYRIWLLMHYNKNKKRVPIENINCSSQDDYHCFSKIYKKYYKNKDDSKNKLCLNACTNGSGDSCYECLRTHYGQPICSRDIFSIRPNGFIFTLKDNNQTNNYVINNQIKSITNSYDNNKSSNVTAGYKYILDVNATTYKPEHLSLGYYFIDANNTKNISMLYFNNKSNTCIDKNDTKISIYLNNGITKHFNTDLNTSTNIIQGKNAGNYYLHMEDNDWTAVDHKNYPYKPYPNHEDCKEGSSHSKHGQLVALRGCSISSNHGKYKDLFLTMHPYKFNIDTISAKSNPNDHSEYIYVNDLNKTKSQVSSGNIMALAIQGNIKAQDYNGKTLSNYTSTCVAKDLDIKLNYKYDKNDTIVDESNNAIVLQSAIKNINGTTVKSIDYNATIDNNFTKDNFVEKNSTSDNGITDYNNYINFERHYNRPINPFKITMKDFNVTSPKDKSYVNMTANYIPKSSKDLNTTKTVYYAKAKPENDVYNDITTNSVKTPMMITLYCSEKLDICNKYGINPNNTITNEYDWWINPNHTANEGHILIGLDVLTNTATVNPTDVESFTNGINDNVTVTAISPNRPLTVHVNPTQVMKDTYPYLLFNKDSDSAPDSLESVTFITPNSAWSGEGKTGHAADVNKSSGRKTNKADW